MILEGRPQPPTPAQGPSENSPLLARQNGAINSEPTSWLSRFIQFQRAHLALPIALLGFMAGAVTTTTSIQIIKVIACQFWYSRHDPSRIPPSGHIPEPLCDAPGVRAVFARIAQATVIIDLCGSLVTSSPIGTLSAKYGRKPLLVIIACVAILSPIILLAALYVNSLGLIFLSTVVGAIGGARPLSLLSTMFIVDLSHDPAPILSVLEGSTYFGLAISFSIGGLITRWSGNITSVFWAQTAISSALALYILFVIPESFGREKRTARAAEIAAQRSRGRQANPRPDRRPSLSRSSSLERVRDTASTYARPLASIWPRRDPVTGKRNKRLFILSLSVLFFSIGASYLGAAFLVYSTNQFHTKPDQTGFLLSFIFAGKAMYLFIVLPAMLRWGRSYCSARQPAEIHSNPEPTGSHFDVHLAAFSFFVESLVALGVALSRSFTAASICLVPTFLSSSANPCISTIVSASVEPLARGEALAAVTLVRAVGEFLSPIILGTILSSTTNTRLPQTVFFVSSICSMFAAGVVVLIRDKDRDQYIASRDDGLHDDDCIISHLQSTGR